MKMTSLKSANWLRSAGLAIAAGVIVAGGVGCKSTGADGSMPSLTQAPTAPSTKKAYNPLTWFKKEPKGIPDAGFSMNTALPDPTNAQKLDLQVAIAAQAESQGDYTSAMAAYKDAIAQEPKNSDLHRRIAVCHDRQGEFAESKAAYGRALKLAPNDANIHCDIGYSNYLQRNWSDSERAYKQALAINPKHLRAYNNLGMLYGRTERAEEALTAFQKGGCREADARSNLAFAMSMEGDFEGAKDQYMLALKANPNSEEAQKGLETMDNLIAKSEGKSAGSVNNAMAAQRVKPQAITKIAPHADDAKDPLLQEVASRVPARVATPALPVASPAKNSPIASVTNAPKTSAVKPAQTALTNNQVAAATPAPKSTTVMRIPAVDEGANAAVVQTSQQYPSTSQQTKAVSPVVQAKDEVELDFVEGSLQRDRYLNEVQP